MDTRTGHACPMVTVSGVAIVGSATTVMAMGVSVALVAFRVTGIVTLAADAGAVYVAVVLLVPLAVVIWTLDTVPHPPAGAGDPQVGVPNATPLPFESLVAVAVRVICPFASTCMREDPL